jgi:HK97 family phage major capsid protein
MPETVNAILRTGAEVLIPEQQMREIVQGTVEQSAFLNAAKRLPNMTSKKTRMPVLDMLPVAYWVDGDTGQKQTTKLQWDKKYINAEELAVIVPIPEAVLDDADYDLWGEIKPRIIEAMGKKVDSATFFGNDKPASWRDSIYDTADNAGAVVQGTADVYNDIMGIDGVIAKVEKSGYFPSSGAASIALRSVLRGVRDEQGGLIFKTDMQGPTQYALDGSPIFFPRNGSWDGTKADLILGDFSQAVYAIRQDVTMKLLTEAVIQDGEGNIVYNLAQQDMVALRVVMRLGWEIPNPINAIEPDESKRTPFAVYKADFQ